jgi:hypothetical protein
LRITRRGNISCPQWRSSLKLSHEGVDIDVVSVTRKAPESVVRVLLNEFFSFLDFNFLDFDSGIRCIFIDSSVFVSIIIFIVVVAFFIGVFIFIIFFIVIGRPLTENLVEVCESLHDLFHLTVVVVFVFVVIIWIILSGGAASKCL